MEEIMLTLFKNEEVLVTKHNELMDEDKLYRELFAEHKTKEILTKLILYLNDPDLINKLIYPKVTKQPLWKEYSPTDKERIEIEQGVYNICQYYKQHYPYLSDFKFTIYKSTVTNRVYPKLTSYSTDHDYFPNMMKTYTYSQFKQEYPNVIIPQDKKWKEDTHNDNRADTPSN
jgi:hypothetical protein